MKYSLLDGVSFGLLVCTAYRCWFRCGPSNAFPPRNANARTE